MSDDIAPGAHPVFGLLSDRVRKALASRLSIVSQTLVDFPEIVDEFAGHLDALEITIPTGEMLNVTPFMVRDRVDELPIAALLAHPPPPELQSHEGYQYLYAWTLVASIALLVRPGNFESAIRLGTRATRLVTRKHGVTLLDQLPDFTAGLNKSVASIRKLHNAQVIGMRAEAATKSRALKRLEAWRNLFNAYLSGRDEIQRTSQLASDDIDPVDPVVISPRPDPSETDFDESAETDVEPTIEVIFAAPEDPQTSSSLPAEEQTDGMEERSYLRRRQVSRSHGARRNRPLQLLEDRRAAMRIAVDEQFLSCDWRRATRAEVTHLTREFDFITAHKAEPERRLCALLVALMMLTGRRYDRLACMPVKARAVDYEEEYILSTKQGAWLVWRPALPRASKIDELPDLEWSLLFGEGQSPPFFLPLPKAWPYRELLGAAGSSKGYHSDLPELLRSYLKELSSRHGRPSSFARLTSLLPTRLREAGTDDVIAAWLCGSSPQHAPQLYYTKLAADQLDQTYRATIKEDFAALTLSPPRNEGPVGSLLVPRDDHIAEVFRYHGLRVFADDRHDLTGNRAIHNRYVIYVHQVMALATGHRPVTAPFENIHDFDLDAKMLWLSDKEVRSGLASRLLPLPRTAARQVEVYVRRLKNWASAAQGLDDRAYRMATAALAGDIPLFFMLDADDAVALTPRRIDEAMADILPLPPNWHRHYLRSRLTGRVEGDLIDGYLGHAAFGKEPNGPSSGLCLPDLRQVSDAIQDIFDELNIRAL